MHKLKHGLKHHVRLKVNHDDEDDGDDDDDVKLLPVLKRVGG